MSRCLSCLRRECPKGQAGDSASANEGDGSAFGRPPWSGCIVFFPGMARIRRGPPVPHLGRRFADRVIGMARPPTPPEIRVRSLRRPNPALPSHWAGGSDRLRSDSPTIADLTGHVLEPWLYRASVGGFRGESGVSGYGRRPNATAFGLHEGLHLEECRPECRGRYHPASWRPPRSPDEYAPYRSFSVCLFGVLLFA